MPSFNNLDVSRKLPIFIVGFSLLAAAVTGGANYLSSRATLKDFAQTKMEIIVGERLERLTAWRDSMFSAIQVKSLNPAVIDATVAFTSAFAAVGENPEKMLQDLYIHQSPHPIGEKQLLVNAEDGSNYSAVHEAYHPFFKAYQEDHGYYDLFLFDPSGNLVYSVFKELDYATNMINGQWASSGLARAFRDAIGAAQGAEPSFIGFEPYGPSADAPASFISQPIFDEGGVLVGVLAFQLPVDRLNSMMTTDPKSGETADAFLVGSDGLMRSTSKFSDGSDLLNTRVEPAIADAAREGVKGSHIGEDRHGREVFASFMPLRIGNVEWLIVAEVETREAFAPIVEMRNNIIINILMISVIALIAGFLLARSLSRPLTRVGDAMEAVADRKFDNEIADVERKDEIGRIANVLASFREKLIAADELAIEAAYKSSGFEQSSEALLMFDMDMNVMYMNASAQKFFGNYEKEFSSYLPDFDIDGIRGSKLDLFPAKPAFQRDTFTDVDNLPYAGDIEVDGLQIGIRANAIIDENQKQIGCVVRITEVTEIRTNAGIIDALRQDQIIVEYDLAGRVQAANDNFLNLVGMGIDDVVGADLVSFMDPRQVDIEQLSSKLKAGEFQSGKFLRKGAGDDIIWTQGAIAPIFNNAGQMVRFVEISTDISEAEHFSFEAGKVLEAFSEKQAVISFTPDGQILSANENLLSTMGYTEDEIIGAMHSKFMPEHERDTLDYRDHWAHLRRGDIVTGVFERINKDGDPVYLQASYTPIIGYDGTVATIRKFATDITEQENTRRANAKIRETMEAELEKVVNALSLGLSKLSQGDLTITISDQFPEAYEELRTDFNLTRQRLSEVVQDIVVTSGGIRNGAGEISHAADDLSRRTESQAAALEETVAALKQLTDSVQTAASDAEKADKFTATAAENAKANEEIVRQSLGAMKKIEDSSDQISQIIGVIDDIAFQTNLLALNAGVEAARAGEAGRGFAVVASEVRALAQRCSDAAKEIKQLISASTQQVEDGVKFVGETSTALEKIIHMVSEINTFVSNISTVSQEQATGVGEIMLAMDQLDGVTQKNAAMVEEMTAASHELTTDSKTLGGLVSRFQLSDTTDAPAAVDGPKPPVKTATASGTPAEPSPAPAPTAPGPVAMPRTSGSAAVNIMAEADDDDWEDF